MMLTLRSLLARLLQELLDIVAAVSGAYYSRKYAAISRRLGLARGTATNRRGFIAIQVDGLAYEHLITAMEMGYLPHLERLLRGGEYHVEPWHSGLPCTTPAAQAGIMFGNSDDIPAFRWYEKRTGESVVCKLPGIVMALQERVAAGAQGILTGGSSFVNMFDGGAARSLFTLGSFNRKHFFESVRGLQFLVLFLLNPFRSLKVVALALWEYLTDLYQRLSMAFRGDDLRPLEPGFFFLRVMSNVVFREIQTFAVMIDVYRGVPSIYTTYYGYDELAHNYGPTSRIALRALHSIDTRIHQIDTLRRMALTREYDLFILSDHGMTRAQPFRHLYGRTLGEVLCEMVGGDTGLNESYGSEQQGALQAYYLTEELAAIERNVGLPLAYIPRTLRKLVSRRLAVNGEEARPLDLLRRTDLVVRNSGSLSHIYFNVTPSRMHVSEIASLYPNLISGLAAHPGIWLVIGREDDQVVIMSRDGVLTLGNGATVTVAAVSSSPAAGWAIDGSPAYTVEGTDPLARLPAPWLAAAQIERLARFSNSGDLILLGEYDPESGLLVCFEQQWACHGGLGGPQEVAFMAMPASIRWNLRHVTRAADLHPLFIRRYAGAQRTTQPDPIAAPGSTADRAAST
jgi:hypothetical protein